MRIMQTALSLAIEKAGGVAAVARACGVRSQAVSQWRTAPAQHVIVLARASAFLITPHAIRPDLYPHPEDGLPEELRWKSVAA